MKDDKDIVDYASPPPRKNIGAKIAVRLVAVMAFTLAGLFVLVLIAIVFLRPRINHGHNAKPKATIIQIMYISSTLDTFKLDNGRFPSTAEGLSALLVCPAGMSDTWHPLLRDLPADSWGNEFRYRCPGIRDPAAFDLDSAGPDGALDTADDLHKDSRP